MSDDVNYIFHYDNQNYIKPSPMDYDINFVKEHSGGFIYHLSAFDLYWEKRSFGILSADALATLKANQILEKVNSENWSIRR